MPRHRSVKIPKKPKPLPVHDKIIYCSFENSWIFCLKWRSGRMRESRYMGDIGIEGMENKYYPFSKISSIVILMIIFSNFALSP